MVYGKGSPETVLTGKDIQNIVAEGTPEALYRNKRVLVLTPDATRTCPLPVLVPAVNTVISKSCRQLDYMVALGTHPVMIEREILDLYGIDDDDRKNKFRKSTFYCHRWDIPDMFHRLGELYEDYITAISGGLLQETVQIDINRRIFNYDLLIILGPVFPHEVVGYSGGAKYLFPGISGGEFLHFFHWLGAVTTCSGIIGIKDTPVRNVIHRAVEKVDVPIHCLSLVVKDNNRICGLYVGDVIGSWSKAADLSTSIHIVTRIKPFKLVIGRALEMYKDIWVAGKVMYKLEQVVADGGTLIIYAPHIHNISKTWGHYIEKIGYHVAEYFLAQMDRFKDIPRGVMAHSTHVKGTGSYENGIEKPRIDVVLATAISQETCRKINLGYIDPATMRLEDFMNREEKSILFVDHAGEILYKLKN